jgi:methyl-accepting chemotaxis protein
MSDAVATRAQEEQQERGRMGEQQRAAEQRLQLESEQRLVAQRARESAERAQQRAQLADLFEQQVSAIVEAVSCTSDELRRAAESLALSTETANSKSRAAVGMASELSEHARRVAQSATRLAELATSVRASADNSHRHARSAHGNAAAARADVDNLIKATTEIGTITDLINSVARQTNILAINARIEAARAGQAGSGFAIVADEVKKLASATHGATNDIDHQVQNVAQAGASSAAALERLRANIGELDEMASAIFGLTDKQSEATADIEGLVQEASRVSDLVTQEVRTAEEAAADAQGLAGRVRTAAESLDAQATDLQLQVSSFLGSLRQSGAGAAADAGEVASGAMTGGTTARVA